MEIITSNYSSWLQRHMDSVNISTTTTTTATSFVPVEATRFDQFYTTLLNYNFIVFICRVLEPLDYFYSVSYMYYSLLGTVITVVIGYVVSICTQSEDDAYDYNLIHPTIYRLYDKYFEHKPYLKKVETKGGSLINQYKSKFKL